MLPVGNNDLKCNHLLVNPRFPLLKGDAEPVRQPAGKGFCHPESGAGRDHATPFDGVYPELRDVNHKRKEHAHAYAARNRTSGDHHDYRQLL